MATLYDISENMRAVEDLLLENGGDISGIDGETIEAWLRELNEDFTVKAEGYCRLIAELQARGEARGAEACRLQALERADFNAADQLKAWLKQVMEARGIKQLNTQNFRLSVCGNGGAQPVEFTAPIEAIPAEYLAYTPTIKMDAVRDALEKGPLPFAKELPRGTHLRIK